MSTAIYRKSGFSLLELLAVMSIVALLTTVAVTSYFSAVRGMGRRSAVNHLASTLTVARQRACMDNSRVSVVFFNEVVGEETEGSNKGDARLRPSYVMCKELGRLTYYNAPVMVDEFTALNAIFGVDDDKTAAGFYQAFAAKGGGIKIYNLDKGRYSIVYPLVQNENALMTYHYYNPTFDPDKAGPKEYYANTGEKKTEIKPYYFKINDQMNKFSDWQTGDSYGIEASPVQNLPNGFVFDDPDDENEFRCITFLPNGTRAASSDSTIKIEEKRPPQGSVTIEVNKSGKIIQKDGW